MPRRSEPAPIRIEFRPELRARGRELVSGGCAGLEVHAGSFLRERRIVLDSALLEQPRELARILTHEVYHFVWRRLGNTVRRSYEELLQSELRQRRRGELGDSSERRKSGLAREDILGRSRRWREYVCESFCDTAAWLAAGGRHSEFTLDPEARRKRRAWFGHVRTQFRIQL